VDSTANPQQIETVEYGFRLVHNKSKSCTANPQQIHNFTTNPQQIHNFTISCTACCATNPQQIHNKSNKWSLSLLQSCLTDRQCSSERQDHTDLVDSSSHQMQFQVVD
jgi:hypothetical protein